MQQAERLESLKSGIVGGGAIALVYLTSIALHHIIGMQNLAAGTYLSTSVFEIRGLVSGAIAVLAGFLFGVTYRYIIREDDNSHLKSGAVLAFGLVRGLAQLDVGLSIAKVSWVPIVWVAESIVMFAIARFVLDWAIRQTWIKPFGSL